MGASFSISYSGLPTPHNIISYSLTFWLIDTWDGGDSFDLVFDTVTLNGWNFPSTPASGNLCGMSTAGDISGITLKGTVAHSASTLTFKVVSQLNQLSDDESFGFRDITMTFAHIVTPPVINNTMCAITPIQMPVTPVIGTCKCLDTEYEYPIRTGNCYACHADCYSCTLFGSTSCTGCKDGKFLSGKQCEPCDTSCATCSTGGSNYCTSCKTGSYLVSSQYCVTAGVCSLPLIQVTGTLGAPDTCDSPCVSLTDFIYWDQTCDATCPAPLLQENIGGLNLCRYPCLTTEYLYWDGTCQSSCDFPLDNVVQRLRNYCRFPCSASQYLQWDGSCVSTCPFYFVEEIKNTLRYCNRRCPLGQYYTQWDGGCVNSCEFPFKTEQYNCGLPCDDSLDYYYPHNNTCLDDCETPYQIENTGLFEKCVYLEFDNFMADAFLLAPYEEGTPTLVVLVRIMQYVRYLNISMTPRLERLAFSKGRNLMSLNYGFSMPEKLQQAFTINPVVSLFQKNKLHSQFVVNFWKDFSWIAIVFIAALIFLLIEWFSGQVEWKTSQAIFGTLRTITLWNFLIVFFATSIDDIILYCSIEFMSFYYSIDTTLDYFSFISCIVLICIVIIFFLLGLYLLITRAPAIKEGETFAQAATVFTTQFRSCGVLFLGLNTRNIVGKFFFLIYMARLGLPMIFAMSLMSEPVINVTMQTALSLAILGCIIHFKPIKSQINQLQLLLFEAIVLVMNVLMLFITVLKVYNVDSWYARVAFGDIVILGNSITNFLVILFAIFKIANEISTASKLIKTKALSQKLSFLIQLLIIPMQQGSMGFECIYGVYSLYSAPTDLGVDADMIQKKTNPIVARRIVPIEPEVVPRLANKQVRAKDFDDSDLRNRISSIGTKTRGYIEADLPYHMNPLPLATIISKQPTSLDRPSSLRGQHHISSSYRRENSIDLYGTSLDSSHALFANNQSILNNTSYDFGDSTIYDNPLSTKKGLKINDSIHFTPAVLRAKHE